MWESFFAFLTSLVGWGRAATTSGPGDSPEPEVPDTDPAAARQGTAAGAAAYSAGKRAGKPS